MRKPFVAGNWKMNLTRDECVGLATALAQAELSSRAEVAVCPPSVYLDCVRTALEGSAVKLGGQNMYHELPGAFTGEISAGMLADLECRFVILGHSERRHVLGETNKDVNRKLLAAFSAGLHPIVCVGELLEQREAGHTSEVIGQQFSGAFANVTAEQMRDVTIAYEPVWAIGTGKVATPAQAEEVHLDLRKMLDNRYNSRVAEAVRIQYGGSVKPENAADLLGQPNIDGALVGGASLKANSFLAIVAAA